MWLSMNRAEHSSYQECMGDTQQRPTFSRTHASVVSIKGTPRLVACPGGALYQLNSASALAVCGQGALRHSSIGHTTGVDQGLEDQLLAELVQAEQPALEESQGAPDLVHQHRQAGAAGAGKQDPGAAQRCQGEPA